MLKKLDLSWFLTTPGILTGLGCLLIVISIIIFISSFVGKKGKKNKVVADESVPIKELNTEEVVDATPTVTDSTPAATNVINSAPVTSVVEPTPVETVAPVVEPTVVEPTPVEVAVTPTTIDPTPVVEPVAAGIVEPVITDRKSVV